MKILIVYGTTEGQTRKIARFINEESEKAGHQVTLCDATANPPKPGGFDIVFIGASMHMHKYQSSVIHYVKEHAEVLNKIKSIFFSVCLSVISKDTESARELEHYTNQFLSDTGWKPVHVEQVAGALLYTKYDFFKKLVMRLISKREGHETDTHEDYEYTDWNKVKAFVDKMLMDR